MIKNFQKHKKFAIFIICFAVMVLGFVGYYFIGMPQGAGEEVSYDLEKELPSVKIEDAFTNIEDLIANYHHYYNISLGWGRYKSINKELELGNVNQLLKELGQLEYEELVEEKDITHIKQLAKIFTEKEDVDALLYLHRIFHDLDKAVNDHKHKDTFGATETYGKKGIFGNHLDDIEDYIKDNQKN